MFWGRLSFGVSGPFTFLGKVLPGSCHFDRSKKDTSSCFESVLRIPFAEIVGNTWPTVGWPIMSIQRLATLYLIYRDRNRDQSNFL